MIKLVLSDVDGTLTDRRRVFSTRAAEEIRKIQDQGIAVSLVSGNVIPVMYSLKTYLGLSAPLFAENGGSMIDSDITSFFTMEKPALFFEHIQRKGLARGILTNRWRLCSMGYDPLPGKEREIIAMAAQFNVEITNSGFSWHILNQDQNKGFALQYIMKAFKLRPEEVLVMGDNMNDMPMFQGSVKKAVPSNAEPELKAMADYVSKLPYGEGASEILSSLNSF